VPLSTEDAYVGDNNGSAIVTSDVNETVNSIATNVSDFLDINGGTFTATQGTGPDINTGTITVDDATLWVTSGVVNNPGTIELASTDTSATSTFLVQDSVTLDGNGSIEMAIGAQPINNEIIGLSPNSSLLSFNDITGTGTIGGLNFTNNGIVESNNATSATPGVLVLEGSAGGGSFLNNGGIIADNGGTIQLGEDGFSSSFNNQGSVTIVAANAATYVTIAGNVTISNSNPSFGDDIQLAGNDYSKNNLVSDGHAATLNLQKEHIPVRGRECGRFESDAESPVGGYSSQRFQPGTDPQYRQQHDYQCWRHA